MSVKIKGMEQLKALEKRLNKLSDKQVDEFMVSSTKELAARLLAKVIKITPTGDYPKSSGKRGGTLKRGWTLGKSQIEYINSLTVTKQGGIYTITVSNNVNYASYVEYGHRTRNHQGWVPGQFMLTLSEQDLEKEMPRILSNKLDKFLGDAFNGK